jgi:hypothetical protein
MLATFLQRSGPVWLALAVVIAVALPAARGVSGGMHGLPSDADCNQCHDSDNFSLIRADKVHTDGTFPLDGEHGRQACKACHDAKLGFGNLSGECTACHTARDAHLRLVGNDCQSCHDPRGWLPNRFRHVSTGFALTGAHRAANCTQCHATGFPVVPTDCVYCHESDFRRAGDEHDGVDLMSCDMCHNTHGWDHARFPH